MKSSSVGRFSLPISLLIILVAALGACAEEESEAQEGEVALTIEAAALRMPSSSAASSGYIHAQALSGQLAAVPRDGGQARIFPWSISIDPDTGAVTSHLTIILAAGLYDFSLLVDAGAQQYYGSATGLIRDTYNTINMTIRPIIGDSSINVMTIDQLSVFRFSYPVEELSEIADPRLGVIVDGRPQVTYLIDKSTGLSYAYVDLPNGPHHVRLNFYDGAMQIGRSIDVQEWVTIEPGQMLSMSLIPFAGETQFELTRAGGDARFTFTFPAEVVDEAGGVGQLETNVSLSGYGNPMRTHSVALTPGPAGTYRASTTFTNMNYGELTMSISFTDTGNAPAQPIGSCTNQVTLRDSASTRPCQLFLIRRAMHSGELISLVGINVLNASGDHVDGAQIFVNGNLSGLSGEGFGTPGYLRRFLRAGQHTISATTPGFAGSISATITPLSIQNLVIRLAPTP